MGILNITPDSFADGGRYNSFESAIAHAREMITEGVDIIDIGGESTRPGAERVSEDEEISRVIPVITELAKDGVRISIDTMRASTALAAIEAGAHIINDVSGGLADQAMYAAVAQLDVPYVIMHWRGHGSVMNSLASYADVSAEVFSEINERLVAATAAGVNPEAIIIDPGLGFSKEPDDNWQVLNQLAGLVDLGYPVLIGASRKRFLGSLLAASTGEPRDLAERDAATNAISAIAAATGVWGVRVHNVQSAVDAVLVGQAWARGRQ